MSNEATTAAENQKKFEEQQRYFMQMQKNMMRQNYAQQIMGAFNTISAYKVLKTASQYGMIFPVDYNSKMVLSQKLYQALVLNNTSTDEDEWKTLANSLMMAQQQTMRNMLFSPQMNNGGMNMGMGMPPQMNMGMPMGYGMPNVNIQPAQFQNFAQGQGEMVSAESIGLIKDVPLEVTVELGRTSKSISDILEFAPGTIIELDKIAGEPIDILVNGKFVAKGEVVVIEESFGVRIMEIVK